MWKGRFAENDSEVIPIPNRVDFKGGLRLGDETNTISSTTQLVLQQSMLLVANGAGTYTGTITIPAGSNILDIAVHGLVQSDAATSSSLIVGDAADDNGFYTATDLKATDLLAGEVNNFEHPGGKAGVYIASEQRVLYQATARSIIAVMTQVGAGTAGRTLIVVTYATPTAGTFTKV